MHQDEIDRLLGVEAGQEVGAGQEIEPGQEPALESDS
jgi:hypothetical protein